MIHQIKSNRRLLSYLCSEIEDEGIHVEIDERLAEDKYAIVKVDGFYNGLHLSVIPKSIDFLAAVDCECNAYVLYLLELKNVKNPKFLIMKDIHEKYQNYEQYKEICDKINKRDSLKIDFSLGGRLYKFKNKVVRIQYDIPPNPVIRRILT